MEEFEVEPDSASITMLPIHDEQSRRRRGWKWLELVAKNVRNGSCKSDQALSLGSRIEAEAA